MSLIVTAFLGALLPGTAAADTEKVTAAWSVTSTDIGTAADDLNFAVAGTLPSRTSLTCHSVPAVEICYEKNGDHWWVQDQDSDGASAAVYWENYRGGGLYRSGFCVNSLGNGKWGQCNTNYYEDSTLYGYPCVWDRSAGDDAFCNFATDWRFQ